MVDRIRGGKGLLWHYESYEGPDQPFKAGLSETPTMTCHHCSVVVILNPDRTRKREWCWNCNSYICDGCKAASVIVGCVDRERTIDLIQSNPDKDIRLDRGLSHLPTPDEIALIEDTKIHQGISIPKGS